jgi:Flp pilus assembly protein TadG
VSRPGSAAGRRPDRAEDRRGSITAETAVVLPILLMFVGTLVWLVSVGIDQARCADAAREAARSLARDDPFQQALSLARESAPDGARIEVERSDGLVTVTVSMNSKPAGGLFGGLVSVDLDASAVSAAEDPDGLG